MARGDGARPPAEQRGASRTTPRARVVEPRRSDGVERPRPRACRPCPGRSGQAAAEAERDQVRRMGEQEAPAGAAAGAGERRLQRGLGAGIAARSPAVGAEVVERARIGSPTARRRDRRGAGRSPASIRPMRLTGDPGAGRGGGDGVAARRRRGEQQLVVVAAGEQALALHFASAGAASTALRGNASTSTTAPTPERRRMWPRSPARPSETSIALVATPRRRMPSAVARRRQLHRPAHLREGVAAPSATVPRNASSASRASPSVPLT